MDAFAEVIPISREGSPVHRAEALFASARYRLCIETLGDANGLEADVLRLRSHLRLGQISHALELVDRTASSFAPTDAPEHKALLLIWGARAYSLSGAQWRADALLDRARREASKLENDDIRALLGYVESLNLSARQDVDINILHDLVAPAIRSATPVLRAQALEWKAFLFARAGARNEQVETFEAAWNAVATDSSADQYLSANILLNTALVSHEQLRTDISAQVASRMLLIDWIPDLDITRYLLIRTEAWARALVGDTLQAYALLRKASQSASTPGLSLLSTLDRLHLQSFYDEPTRDDVPPLRSITSVADTIDWLTEPHQGAALATLLSLAEFLVPTAPELAAQYLNRFGDLVASIQRRFQVSFDKDVREAAQKRAAALLSVHLGRTEEAISLYNRAFTLWSGAGYRWRAADVAADLLGLGAASSEQQAYLRAVVDDLPRSWIAKKLCSVDVTSRRGLPVLVP